MRNIIPAEECERCGHCLGEGEWFSKLDIESIRSERNVSKTKLAEMEAKLKDAQAQIETLKNKAVQESVANDRLMELLKVALNKS